MSFTKKKILILWLLCITGVLYVLLRFTPVRGLEDFKTSFYSIPVYSSQNNLLAVLPLKDGLRRQFLPYEDLSVNLKDIILQSEDKRFYFHPGFDPVSLSRAYIQYVKTGEIESGASTITMQLARMIHPRAKGINGKLIEIFNAVRLEARFRKKEIFELYFNHLPFGSNIEGIKSAAYFFLGKEVCELTSEELLILMMIPRRPEDYNPLNNQIENKAALLRTLPRIKQDLSMSNVDLGYKNVLENVPSWPSEAPHFIQMIRSELTEAMWQSGESVYSSLDEEFQSGAESYLKDILSGTVNNRISNGAVLAIDNNTGKILAYIGSADFYNNEIQGQIDGVRILRQPGSTLKPFLYAKAIEAGFSPSTPLPDIPLEFGHREVYIPENYNERYNGPVRLSVALGSSLNVPSVYLLERLGVKSFLDKLISSGFQSLVNKESLGVGLALGNGEVSLFELVQGFSIFSRGGEFIPLTYYDSVERIKGQLVYPSDVAEMIRNILSNKKNRILGFGRSSPLDVNFDAYFKTGTSNQFNNIWALGSSQDISVGVWMGNFSGETVIGSPGSSYPARVVVSLLEDFHRIDDFKSSVDFVNLEICSLSGYLAGPKCTYTLIEQFPEDSVLKLCNWHRDGKIFLPEEYFRWSTIYRQDFEIDDSLSSLEIIQPKDGALFYLDPTIHSDSQGIAIRISGRDEVSLYINDKLVHIGQAPLTYMQDVQKGLYKIRAVEGSETKEASILVK